MKHIDRKLKRLQEFKHSSVSTNLSYRKNTLKKLYHSIRDHERELYIALNKDFRKPVFESYVTEIGIVLDEIRYITKNMSRWARPKRVSTPIHQFPASSRLHYEPWGVVLIIAPWNYPVQLLLSPLIGAVAAGNSVMLKPSEHAPHTAETIERIIRDTFDPEHAVVVTGGVDETKYILKQKFDYIFYTGNTRIGKIVMKAAADHITPVTLELGGKSPVIIDEKAEIRIAARRIVWGKFLNSGQTCVAPDYCLVHESRKDELIEEMKKELKQFYGMDVSTSPYFARMINKKHFHRVVRYMKDGTVVHGGKSDEADLYIEPTIVDNPPLDSPVMMEEIFGPVLPLVSVSSLDEAIAVVRERPNPLAMYIFSSVRKNIKRVLSSLHAGGVTVNDTVVHLSNLELPFGGVGYSGIGSYHGRKSFYTFSHEKSVMTRGTWLDLPLRYPPYTRSKLKIIKQLIK